MIALSPRAAAWLRQHLPARARAHVFALAGPGFVAVEDWPPRQPPTTTLLKCIALAMLLHLLLVLVLGSAPPGTATTGQGVWGAINITLRGALPGSGPAPATPAPEAYSGPIGTATERRWGGAVRTPDATPADAEPGAARLGTWNALPTTREADLEAPLQRAPAPVLQADEPARVPSVPDAVAPIAPPAAEATLSALPSFRDAARPMLEGAARPLEPAPPLELPPTRDLSPIAPLPRAMPSLAPPPARVDAVPAPRRSEPLPMPADLPPASSLRPLPPLPEPKALPPLPAASPRMEQALPREAAAPLAAPRLAETPAPPVVPPPLVPEPKLMQPLDPSPAAAATPPTPIDSVQRIDAPALPPLPKLTAVPVPVPTAEPGATPSAAEVPRSDRSATASPGTPTMAAPVEVGPGVPRPAGGAPDAGARAGRDVATPPSEAASAPRLNLDLARPRGGEISSQGSRGVLQLMPRPPEVKSKLATDIEKAGKADCRTAHSGAGLLAVGPLVADALSGKGCKW